MWNFFFAVDGRRIKKKDMFVRYMLIVLMTSVFVRPLQYLGAIKEMFTFFL